MALLPSLNKTFNYEAISSLANVSMVQETFNHPNQHLTLRKRLHKDHKILKLKKKMDSSNKQHYKLCKEYFRDTTSPIIPYVYPCPVNDYICPLTVDYNQLYQPLVTIPIVPIFVPSPNAIVTPICTYAESIFRPISPIIPPTAPIFAEDAPSSYYASDYVYSCRLSEEATVITNTQLDNDHNLAFDTNKNMNNNKDNTETPEDVLESYLKLPKDLFPTANMFAVDPNPIINEFCKLKNIDCHTPWILDLEFGVPKAPTIRPIPIYDVKFNSIHCKNSPYAIHPGFESCDPDFKKVLMFYYDCIVSAWYMGYVIMNCDNSVENFQSWLLLPMQVLGMCWP